MRISKELAREVLLASQGFSQKSAFGKGVVGTMNAIRHLGYVQLDTLAVVARAHHHTLWNRNKTYTEFHLDALLREGKVFEYWSHAASYIPIEDFRYSLPRKLRHRAGHAHWFSRNKKLMKYVLDRIRAEGPLQSKDFETDRKRGTWFDWKPAKIALEQLFMEGSLMVKRRQGFQKVYDLAERIIPADVDQTVPTTDEYAEYLVNFNLRALGVATIKDFIHLRAGMQAPVLRVVKKMIKDGRIIEVAIAGVKEPYFAFSESLDLGDVKHTGVNILSPFDNLVIRRERINKIFDWDYTLECYLPEHKRKFGYFSLPVLYRGTFAGMFDPKADRSTGTFHVRQAHFSVFTDDFASKLRKQLTEFAAYNGCRKIQVDPGIPLRSRRLLGGK